MKSEFLKEGYIMKMFDMKSLVAGIILGTLGITTAFAATGIQSAALSSTKVTLNGDSLPLMKSLVLVTMDDEERASLYVPADELLQKLGYTVNYDDINKTIDIIPENNTPHETTSNIISAGNIVINLANNTGQRNIAESGSFRAEHNQVLTLDITSDIKGGTVDLFLFDPKGNEQRITIEAANITKEIELEEGIWQYNCSGIFKDGGNVKIVGTIK